MNRTISDNFPQPVSVEPGYERFFSGIMEIVNGGQADEKTGETLRDYVRGFLKTCDLGRFRKAPDEPYSRIYLGRDDATGWEAIMMCWAKESTTTIHGHPGFAAYNFAEGRFRVELFDLDAAGDLRPNGSVETFSNDGFFAVGNPETFDNHIHRITCMSDTGHSLHIYCGDARNGVIYEDAK